MNRENLDEKKSNKLIIILLIVLIVLVFTIGIILVSKKDDKSNNFNKNSIVSMKYKYSFQTLDASDVNLTEEQRELAKFFDENYFFLSSYDELIRYADTLKNIKVATYCQVKTFLLTDDDDYEVVCNWGDSYDYFWGSDDLELIDSIIIKGKKPEKMFVVNDTLTIKGKIVGAETRNIDGKNKYLPVIEVVEAGVNADWYSEETIRKVAKLVFGNNIKIRRPIEEESMKMVNDYFYSYQDSLWLIEFENQSNLDFKVFDIWGSTPHGFISYNALYNRGIESDYLNKKLYITPDLKKYIVFDMSRIDELVYISVYNRDLEKLWSREISNVSNITWDATDTQLVFVSDNDMYNIDLETGKDIVKPIYVGKKNSVAIVENGYILLSENKNDAVMFVDKNWNIKNKFDINLEMSGNGSLSTSLQKLDNDYVILYSYVEVTDRINVISKYIIVDKNGNLVKETN